MPLTSDILEDRGWVNRKGLWFNFHHTIWNIYFQTTPYLYHWFLDDFFPWPTTTKHELFMKWSERKESYFLSPNKKVNTTQNEFCSPSRNRFFFGAVLLASSHAMKTFLWWWVSHPSLGRRLGRFNWEATTFLLQPALIICWCLSDRYYNWITKTRLDNELPAFFTTVKNISISEQSEENDSTSQEKIFLAHIF